MGLLVVNNDEVLENKLPPKPEDGEVNMLDWPKGGALCPKDGVACPKGELVCPSEGVVDWNNGDD